MIFIFSYQNPLVPSHNFRNRQSCRYPIIYYHISKTNTYYSNENSIRKRVRKSINPFKQTLAFISVEPNRQTKAFVFSPYTVATPLESQLFENTTICLFVCSFCLIFSLVAPKETLAYFVWIDTSDFESCKWIEWTCYYVYMYLKTKEYTLLSFEQRIKKRRLEKRLLSSSSLQMYNLHLSLLFSIHRFVYTFFYVLFWTQIIHAFAI